MAYLLEDVLEGVKKSRAFFLKHLKGVNDDQWSWKPYAECKSLSETLAHLVLDDRMALYSLEAGKEPDYEANLVTETDKDKLIAMLHDSHEMLVNYIAVRFKDTPLDVEAHAWGAPMKLAQAIGYLSSEDYYHSGQAGFIRMATDPRWNYYENIYGGDQATRFFDPGIVASCFNVDEKVLAQGAIEERLYPKRISTPVDFFHFQPDLESPLQTQQ